MKSRSLVVMTILALLLATTMVTMTTAQPTTETEIVWRLETEEVEPEIRWLTETLALQIFVQEGDVYDVNVEEYIGTIDMQIRFLIDIERLEGHANVKFVIELGEEGSITGVMNGKIWYVDDPFEGDQLISGRFAGNGAYHIHGRVSHQDTPEVDTVLLTGWKW